MSKKLITYLKRSLKYIIWGQPHINTTIVNPIIETISPNAILKGKKILITGGTRGIGQAMALKFISEGADVLITGRNVELGTKFAAENKCHFICNDVSNIDNVEDVINKAKEILGGIDFLINNAGISLHENCFCNVQPKQFDEQFNINLKGTYFLTQAFVKYIITEKRKGCKILFISSERGEYVDDLPYGLTKVSINSLIRALAYELIEYDIRVYGISPGITATKLAGFDKTDNLYLQTNRSQRLYLPIEIAEIACFLLTNVANILSGNILVCDEGRSINTYKKNYHL